MNAALVKKTPVLQIVNQADDAVPATHNPAIRAALSWYLDVAENRRPAKFRIAATVAAGLDPAASSEDALWAKLDRLTPLFLARWQAIRAGARLPPAADGPSLLELCREYESGKGGMDASTRRMNS